jgi:hypothetical protein
MDHAIHLPNAYRCALEYLNNGERTASRLSGLIAHYETATGLNSTPSMAEHLRGWRDATHRIAARRYWDFQPEA